MMGQRTYNVDPQGVPNWKVQRVHRLAREGKSIRQIAKIMEHSGHDQIRRMLNTTSQYERCPGCRGLVLMPCQVCELRRATR